MKSGKMIFLVGGKSTLVEFPDGDSIVMTCDPAFSDEMSKVSYVPSTCVDISTVFVTGEEISTS